MAGGDLLLRLALLAVLVVAGPTLMRWWLQHGEDVVRPVVPSAADLMPSETPDVYDRCRALRDVYTCGVRAEGARNAGRKLEAKPATDGAVAAANAALDVDGDGLVCELSKGPRRGSGSR